MNVALYLLRWFSYARLAPFLGKWILRNLIATFKLPRIH